MVPFARKAANVEDVFGCIQFFFDLYRTVYAIYCDSRQHFDNERFRLWLSERGIIINYSGSGSSKSTGMVEMSNKLLEEVLERTHQERTGIVALPKQPRQSTRGLSIIPTWLRYPSLWDLLVLTALQQQSSVFFR